MASFFGATALGRDDAAAPVLLAGVALMVTVLGGLYILYPHRLQFSVDVRRFYDVLAPKQDDPESVLLALAFGLRDARAKNERRIDALKQCLSIASFSLVAQTACWTWALVG